MKTDKLFYRIFLSEPSLIAELLSDIPEDCQFEYSAPVVKEKEIRLDGVLTPISDDPDLPIIFLEAQMQRDPEFYSRYFSGLFLYLHQYKITRLWRGLLILRDRSQDLGSQRTYQTLLNQQVQRLYLDDLLTQTDLSPNLAILKLIVTPETEAVSLAQSILGDLESVAEFRQKLDLVEAILVNKFPKLSIEEIQKCSILEKPTSPKLVFIRKYYKSVAVKVNNLVYKSVAAKVNNLVYKSEKPRW